jgi:Zn-finger nucleic acid-binding protein
VAHELAHVVRGDTYYITLVCSLANFFERLRDALEPEDEAQWGPETAQGRVVAPWLVFIGLTVSSILMHLLSALISREREILADAVAVELSRSPKSLARAIYKAHLKNSFVGDFNLTYTPLFIVPPESKGEEDGFFDRLFNSHPPLMKRIELLAKSAHIKPSRVIEEVWEIRKKRERARTVVASSEDRRQTQTAKEPLAAPTQLGARNIWSMCGARGQWRGPYNLEELLFIRNFSPLIRVRNEQEGVEAQAREFPQIREALRKLGRKKPVDPAKHNRCPRCSVPFHDGFYEGVNVKTCPRCRGKLVDAGLMERIIARKEVGFSEALIQKAEEFRRRFMHNPILTKKISAGGRQKNICPDCGSRMLPRPYSYHYVVPVDKCLSCYKIWFDEEELEILQILIERR